MNEESPVTATEPSRLERKSRADSPLWNMGEERQAEVIEYLRDHTFTETRKMLAAEGIQTSEGSLCQFRAKYLMRRKVVEKAAAREVVEDEMKAHQEQPTMTSEELFGFGQDQLAMQALLNGNVLE